MPKITVVGSLNMDLVARVERMPSKGETVSGMHFAIVPGGKGANQAVCAARLGGAVRMIGRVGQDVFADQLRASLTAAQVECDGVLTETGPSGTALIIVDRSGANSIIVVPGANNTLQPASLEEHLSALRDASILLTQLETPLAATLRLGVLAAEAGIPFILDPAPAQALPADLLANVTWLTPNESETCTLLRGLGHTWGDSLPEDALAPAADLLLQQGVRNVVLKLGERGVFAMGHDLQPTRLPAFKAQTVDTTAAGDAFNGGLAYALTEGALAPEAAVRFASAVAAASVTRAGAQPSMPSLREVQALLYTQSV